MSRVIILWTRIGARLLGTAVWISGIVLASGFWSTFFAISFPPWGMYLVAEKALHVAGWL